MIITDFMNKNLMEVPDNSELKKSTISVKKDLYEGAKGDIYIYITDMIHGVTYRFEYGNYVNNTWYSFYLPDSKAISMTKEDWQNKAKEIIEKIENIET